MKYSLIEKNELMMIDTNKLDDFLEEYLSDFIVQHIITNGID